MKHMTRQEDATANEVLDQYSLNPAQRLRAEEELEKLSAEAPFRFTAYVDAHRIAAKVEREATPKTIESPWWRGTTS